MTSNLDYFKKGTLVTEYSDTRVYTFMNELYMETGGEGNLTSSEDDLRNYIWQLGKAPCGNVLVLGLGLGLSVKYLLSLPNVKTITVIEPNKGVIVCQQKLKNAKRYEKVFVYNAGYLKYLYETNKRFDFVFIDCYRYIDETSFPFIMDVVFAAKKVCSFDGTIVGWADEKATEHWLSAFQKLFY